MFTKRWLLLLLMLGLSGCASLAPILPPSPPLAETAPAVGAPQPVTPLARVFRVVAGGDVLPGDYLTPYLKTNGFDYPYQNIKSAFQAADIGLVNLECPLAHKGKRVRGKKFTFCGQPEAAEGMKQSGITAVALANNHMLDFGPKALFETLQTLQQTGIVYSGAGKNLTEARQPGKIHLAENLDAALLSYSLTYPEKFWASTHKPGTALARLNPMVADIQAAKRWAKIVIVCFHWGSELHFDPHPYQEEYGRAAIRAGAQLVVGTHPHVLQGIEWYQNGLILYSLGNLAFGGGKSKRAVTSGLVGVDFSADGVIQGAQFLPLTVDNRATHFIPTPMTGKPADDVFQFMTLHSQAWKTQIQPLDSGWGNILMPTTMTAQDALVEKQP